MANKTIIVSVISDLYSDQRVHKVCTYLVSRHAKVICVGRRFHDSQPLITKPYETHRLTCFFRKGPMQYFEFNFRLLLYLVFHRADVYLSNDLDTLLPNFLVSSARGKPLVYDSHEYFTGMAELETRTFKRKAWKMLERWILPKLRYAYTVNRSIQQLYKKEYNIDMGVVRNVPELMLDDGKSSIPTDGLLIVQGAGMNEGRGLEEIIMAMTHLPNHFRLLLVGSGTVWEKCRRLASELNLNERVEFKDRVPFEQLRSLTQTAWLGLSMDKPVSTNNRLFLPNKLFDYIHAGIPVLASALPEVKTIIEQYSVGYCIEEVTPEAIAAAIEFIYAHPEQYRVWKENTRMAAGELNWQLETTKLDHIYSDLV